MGRTRCDCKKLSFVGLRSFARRHNITDIRELIRQTGCCTGCGTCRPHLEEFLRTGEVNYSGQRFKLPEIEWPDDPDEPSADVRDEPKAD
jgi:bacterioferritin-associated ferredoxin